MRIAIIDDGVSREATNLQLEQYTVVDGLVQESKREISYLSHGSICAKIIEKYVTRKDITFISVQVLNQDDVGDISDLITALRWCLDNKIDIINMSLGTTPCCGIDELNSICQRLHKSGCRIIAASNNSGELSFPAGFPFVTSVEQRRLQTEYKFWYCVSDIVSEGEHELFQEDKLFYSEKCNSYACAYVSAQIINQKFNHAESFNRDTHILPFKQIYDFSMLSDVVLLSNSVNDNRFCFESTFFPCSGESPRILLIVPNKMITKNDILTCLDHYVQNLELVVWCGPHIPHFLQKWCRNQSIRFWDESVNSSTVLSEPPEMPIIQFIGQGDFVFDIMDQINAMFINDGYNTIRCSDIDHAYLYGMKKIYNCKSLALYSHHFKPDIILFYTHDNEMNAYDAKIVCKSEKHIEILLVERSIVFNTVNEAYNFLLVQLGGETTT